MARSPLAAAGRRRRRSSLSLADEASSTPLPPRPSRPPRRVAHPVLATMALLMLSSSSSSSVVRAAVTATAPGSPTMGCWRHPQERPGEKGTLARCEGFVDVGPRQGKLFTFTIPPKDVDNRAYDIEVVLETEDGDLDLYVYPPNGSSLKPFASSRAVGRDTAYISRSSLFPGRYDFLVTGGPEGRGKGKTTVEFVTPRRRMLNATAAALKGFLSTCCDVGGAGAGGTGTRDGDDAASRPCSRLLQQAAPLADAPPLEVPDYCSVAGIICARNGSLLELNLPRSGLSCDLSSPAALPALAAAAAPTLAALDLSGNDLTRTRIELVAPSLGSLTSLESLDLSASGLRGDLGAACAMAFPRNSSSSSSSSPSKSRSRLRSVNLAANEVGGSLPPCLVSETPSLQALHLDFNPLVGALPPRFGEGLVLFTAAAPAAISSDDGDEGANGGGGVGGGGARSGGITGALPATLPAKMAHLDLSNNRLEGPLPASLPESMTQLHLGGNALSGELPATLFSSSSSQRLRSLRLGSNSLTGPLPDSWAASSALRVLDLSTNALGGELPSNWSRAEYLSVLSLADNALEGALPATLAASRALVVLDVSGNRLSGGLTDFANALPVRGERGEGDRGSLLKSLSIARNPGLDEGTLAAAAALSRLGAFAPPPLEPAVRVPGREEAVASASAAFARRKAVGLRGGGAGSSSSAGNGNGIGSGETLVPPALPGIQEPSDAEMIAAASPRVFDATGCAGLGGPFPAWLVTATAAASSAVAAAAAGAGDVSSNARPAVDIRLAGVPLSCPPAGALFSVREQPPRRAFEGLACEAMPEGAAGSGGGGGTVPISSLLRITGEKDAAAAARAKAMAAAAAANPDAAELGKARARATAVRVIGVVFSLATVATALALCARSCCGSSHRSRGKASSSGLLGLGGRFSRWRSSSCNEGGPSGAISSSSSSSDPSAATSSAVRSSRPLHKSASASAVVVSASCAASPLAGASASLFVGSNNSEDKI